jgi:adenylate cyclase
LNEDPRLLTAVRRLRGLLPGDSRFGDPLSVAGDKQSDLVGRRLSELTAERPGVLREAGLSALQVWQAVSEAQGRGRGDVELTILFTDLVDFSDWAVRAGDEAALALLRDVSEAIEPPVRDHGGEVVKRLGDGMMAVFADTADAVDAVNAARDGLAEIEADGYRPVIRAGIHRGQPRRIGGDYLGVDVNVAARIAEQAGPDELLVSDRVVEELSEDAVRARRKRLFRGKGVPKDMSIYSLEPSR